MRGKIVFIEHESQVLKGNPLIDPNVRRFPVYLPPGYELNSDKRYPVIFGLTGFTGSGEMYLNKKFGFEPFDELLDGLHARGMPGVIYVMPDCLTKYGGSQYVNSTAVGRYENYIVDELVPFIDSKFKTTGRRGCIGGSSGGIGSFTMAAKHPEIFQAFADHCGDSAFEYCYLADVPKVVQAMATYDYKIENFMNHISTIQPKDDKFMVLLNFFTMSACYAPNPDVKPLGFESPVDLRTGKLNERVWAKFLNHDPVQMVDKYKENLKKLSFAFIDCGRRDQFHLYLGSRQLVEKFKAFGIKHVYEEYDSDHGLLRREQKKKSIPMVVRALEGL
jgi:enterochelin esterase-like enzyme